jgi:hypothetical protein
MPTTNHVRPLDFEVYARQGPTNYGACYMAIGLPDGREAFVHGDRADVLACGALVIWRDTREMRDECNKPIDREPIDNPEPTLILAPGVWVHWYAASVWDGSPVSVESLAAPTTRSR